ncbi:510_t:CDS:2, partial [Dentiscutata heterogama]
MPAVLSKISDLLKFSSSNSNIAKIRQLIERIWNIYKNNRTTLGWSIWIFSVYFLYVRNRNSPKKKRITNEQESTAETANEGEKPKSSKVEVDSVFFERLKKLLRIIIPGIRSKELWLLIIHSFFLVFRTILSVYVAALDGRIVSAL